MQEAPKPLARAFPEKERETAQDDAQSFLSFNPSVLSLSRTSLSEVTPKFLHSSSSSPDRFARSPTLWMFSLLMHLRARTERLSSLMGLLRIAWISGETSWGGSLR